MNLPISRHFTVSSLRLRLLLLTATVTTLLAFATMKSLGGGDGPAAPASAGLGGVLDQTAEPASSPPAALPAESYGPREPVLVGSETWDSASRYNVATALQLLPPSIRQALGNPALGPVSISVSSEGRTLSGAQPYGGPANFFSTNEGDSQVVIYPAQTPKTILHELGHAYNLRRIPAGSYALVYLDEEMQSFMAATGWHVLTPPSEIAGMRDQVSVTVSYDGPAVWTKLSRDDPLEDFANSFALYFADPPGLAQLSSARFYWFEDRFGDLVGR